MSTDRDVTTRIVRSWLHEDAHEDADRILNLVLDEIDTTPQRRANWLARRFPPMNTYLKVGLAAAAVVLAAFIGIQLLNGPNVGPSPSETASPNPSALEPSALASAATGLPVGPYVLWNQQGVPAITVTIAAPGWAGEGGILVKNDSPDPPDGAGMIVFTEPLFVYGDPCHWSTTRPVTAATTVDAFVAAMSAQALRDATAPVDITVGGYAGKSVTLHVPDDAVFDDCDDKTFGSWSTSSALGPERYHQGPGQIDELWILDVGGTLVVMDAGYYAATPAGDVSEIQAMANSATFELR